jgi:hypothetical protein
MNTPFRQPTENEEDMDAMIAADTHEFEQLYKLTPSEVYELDEELSDLKRLENHLADLGERDYEEGE